MYRRERRTVRRVNININQINVNFLKFVLCYVSTLYKPMSCIVFVLLSMFLIQLCSQRVLWSSIKLRKLITQQQQLYTVCSCSTHCWSSVFLTHALVCKIVIIIIIISLVIMSGRPQPVISSAGSLAAKTGKHQLTGDSACQWLCSLLLPRVSDPDSVHFMLWRPLLFSHYISCCMWLCFELGHEVHAFVPEPGSAGGFILLKFSFSFLLSPSVWL